MNMIARFQQRRLRRAMRLVAEHILVSRDQRYLCGVDCARSDLDTIVVAIKEDIKIELSESLKAAVRTATR